MHLHGEGRWRSQSDSGVTVQVCLASPGELARAHISNTLGSCKVSLNPRSSPVRVRDWMSQVTWTLPSQDPGRLGTYLSLPLVGVKTQQHPLFIQDNKGFSHLPSDNLGRALTPAVLPQGTGALPVCSPTSAFFSWLETNASPLGEAFCSGTFPSHRRVQSPSIQVL